MAIMLIDKMNRLANGGSVYDNPANSKKGPKGTKITPSTGGVMPPKQAPTVRTGGPSVPSSTPTVKTGGNDPAMPMTAGGRSGVGRMEKAGIRFNKY